MNFLKTLNELARMIDDGEVMTSTVVLAPEGEPLLTPSEVVRHAKLLLESAHENHLDDERAAWDQYAAHAVGLKMPGANPESAAASIATQADAFLVERRKRFGPKGMEEA